MATHWTCVTKSWLTNPILYALSAKFMLTGLDAAVDSTFPEADWALIFFLNGRCCRLLWAGRSPLQFLAVETVRQQQQVVPIVKDIVSDDIPGFFVKGNRISERCHCQILQLLLGLTSMNSDPKLSAPFAGQPGHFLRA